MVATLAASLALASCAGVSGAPQPTGDGAIAASAPDRGITGPQEGPSLAADARTNPGAPDTPVLLHAGRLLADPATGRVTTERTLVIERGRISRIDAGYTTIPGARVVDLRESFVMPGLIDSHVHLTSEQGPQSRINSFLKTSADLAMDGAGYARLTLEAGFTTVADLGGEAQAVLALRDGIAAGKVPGPRIIASAGGVSVHGGHGDANGMPRALAERLRGPGVCSGADDCRRAVRERVRDGADIIKITATGGVLSQTAAGLGQQFSNEELKAIVEAAHSMGRKVTAHAHGVDGVNSFLAAGGDSIEHGTYSDATSVKLYKQNGAYLVPTLLAGDFVAREAERPGTFLSPAQAAKARIAGPLMLGMVTRMHAAGVKIAFGTDTGVSAHGDNAEEFALLVKAGLTPIEAIRSATVNAADHLGIAGDVGSLAPGKVADVIAVKGDPLTDVTALEDVSFVMARGAVHLVQ
ncbi:amidohydrolase family protein [bacterium]|nr:amidohydrolase family protein [bacterium]